MFYATNCLVCSNILILTICSNLSTSNIILMHWGEFIAVRYIYSAVVNLYGCLHLIIITTVICYCTIMIAHIEMTRLYKLVTRLWQGCNKVVCNEQGGDKVVTRWWQGCDNIYYHAHGGDKVVTSRLFPTSKVMTRLSQPCDKVVQHAYNLVRDKIKTHNVFWYLSVRLHIQS